jgi:hypothetical protein
MVKIYVLFNVSSNPFIISESCSIEVCCTPSSVQSSETPRTQPSKQYPHPPTSARDISNAVYCILHAVS